MKEAIELLIEYLKKFEGLRLVAYRDQANVWTIGYGETLGITEGMVWTAEQAENRLRYRAVYFLVEAVKSCPQLLMEPPTRVAATVSLCYNIGIAAFKASTVRRKTAAKLYTEAADAFLLWNKANGRVNRGLVWRREQERKLYLGV